MNLMKIEGELWRNNCEENLSIFWVNLKKIGNVFSQILKKFYNIGKC